ncbi:hypothetical protein GGI15_003050 [Coemansia interrupta]|uniref:Uncharacterized protein n=1 Tax=Coemansia interrupta TaxID=1126814 RepID=A0A9W8LIL3_9FUNG|nr:hypothetical protein GGI15_003050 [Coemansia interrupta]
MKSYVFGPAFNKKTLVGKDQRIPEPGSGNTFYLSWQEPSQYEVFVYTSTLSTIPNNATSFFDKAQLLWRTDSQTLENRYPQFQKSVSVTIPELVRNDRSKTRSLFLHVFAQTTSKDRVIPDTSDPYLAYSVTPLVRWDSSFGASLTSAFSKGPSSKPIFGGESKLVVSKSVSWAMSLENHAYTRELMPTHISRALKLSNTLNQRKRYNPPMFVNSFTQNVPQAVELKQVSGGSARKQTYPETVDVHLELRGIKQGWITSKNTFIRIFEPDFLTKPGSGRGNGKDNAMRAIIVVLMAMVYNFVARLSVTTLVTIIYCVLFSSVAAVLAIKAKLLFWLLLVPVFVLVFLYSLFAHSPLRTHYGMFAYTMINYATVLRWSQWIPQIIINYRTQSGTWIPVLANAYELAATMLLVAAIEISGLSLSFGNMSRQLPNQIFNTILVAQWIKYRFF